MLNEPVARAATGDIELVDIGAKVAAFERDEFLGLQRLLVRWQATRRQP